MLLAQTKRCLAFFKDLSPLNLNLILAWLAFIDITWHVLSNDIVYLVLLNLESLQFFCGFSVTAFFHRCFVEL